MNNSQIKDNIITGNILGVNVKKNTSCVACKKAISTGESSDETYMYAQTVK